MHHGSTYFPNHAPASFCITHVSVLVMILTYVYNEELHVWCHVIFQVLTATSMNFRVFSDILSCGQIDVDICLTTWQYIPEDSELQSGYR
jgi:hypothetical protein